MFMILEVMVVEAPAKRPIALATVKSSPRKFKMGIRAIPAPVPPIEKSIDRRRESKQYKK
jgi:hypothetical protein